MFLGNMLFAMSSQTSCLNSFGSVVEFTPKRFTPLSIKGMTFVGSLKSAAADFKLPTNVMPFILRGVNLLGVNSTTLPNEFKQEVWDDIANNMLPKNIQGIVTKEVTLKELPEQFQAFLDGSIVGRVLVKV